MKQSSSVVAAILLAVCHTSGAFISPSKHDASAFSVQSVLQAVISKPRVVKSTSSALALASGNDSSVEEEPPSWSFNPLFASLWVGFLTFAVLGPGEIGAASDTKMITDYIANPTDPGFSEGFQLIFNYLGIMPMIVACTAVPQAAQRGLPPLPFLVSSFAMGYGGVGTFFVLFCAVLVWICACCCYCFAFQYGYSDPFMLIRIYYMF